MAGQVAKANGGTQENGVKLSLTQRKREKQRQRKHTKKAERSVRPLARTIAACGVMRQREAPAAGSPTHMGLCMSLLAGRPSKRP